MPDEVKPSLSRLTKIAEDSEEDSDKHLLAPILGVLSKYVEQKSEQEKLKKQTNRAYVATVISFIAGAISLYFTLTSPSAKDIAREIQATTNVQVIEHNNSSNPDAKSGSGS